MQGRFESPLYQIGRGMTQEEYNELKENDVVIVVGAIGVIRRRYAPRTMPQWRIETRLYTVIPLTVEQFLKDVIIVKKENAKINPTRL